MKNYASNRVRNVVLLGHSGSGKTTYSEAALYYSGATKRFGKVEDETLCPTMKQKKFAVRFRSIHL